MKMSGFIVMLLAGLVVCGRLVSRHRHRTAEGAAPAMQRPADNLRPVAASPVTVSPTPSNNPDWWEKLRDEEAKQRPWEGRN